MTATIGSTTVVTLRHAPLQETIKRKGEMRNASHGQEKETPITTEEMIATIIVEGRGVTRRKTVKEEEEKRTKQSKREGDSSRQIGTRVVCMLGKKMITMLTRENYNSSLKNNWLAETIDNSHIITLRSTLSEKSK